jgi:hypothetical protein
MARPRNNAKHLFTAVEALVTAVTNLVASIDVAMSQAGAQGKVRKAAADGAYVPAPRGPGKNNPKLKAAIAASWKRMTPAERKERVRRMLAGRGLKPKKA